MLLWYKVDRLGNWLLVARHWLLVTRDQQPETSSPTIQPITNFQTYLATNNQIEFDTAIKSKYLQTARTVKNVNNFC